MFIDFIIAHSALEAKAGSKIKSCKENKIPAGFLGDWVQMECSGTNILAKMLKDGRIPCRKLRQVV